jgi:DNA mismatch repair ATPase MutS
MRLPRSQEVNKIKGKYIDLATQKSGSIFTTKKLKALSEEHSSLTQLYEKTQRSLVKEVVAIAGETHSRPGTIAVLRCHRFSSHLYPDPGNPRQPYCFA